MGITSKQTPEAEVTCCDCGGEIIYGEGPHVVRIHHAGGITIEHRCRECAEWMASCMWPDDWGPCPYDNRHGAGRA